MKLYKLNTLLDYHHLKNNNYNLPLCIYCLCCINLLSQSKFLCCNIYIIQSGDQLLHNPFAVFQHIDDHHQLLCIHICKFCILHLTGMSNNCSLFKMILYILQLILQCMIIDKIYTCPVHRPCIFCPHVDYFHLENEEKK